MERTIKWNGTDMEHFLTHTVRIFINVPFNIQRNCINCTYNVSVDASSHQYLCFHVPDTVTYTPANLIHLVHKSHPRNIFFLKLRLLPGKCGMCMYKHQEVLEQTDAIQVDIENV